MIKRILKVLSALVIGYVVIVSILVAISPKLVKNYKEDEDFEDSGDSCDYYDDPQRRQETQDFGDLYYEYECERNL